MLNDLPIQRVPSALRFAIVDARMSQQKLAAAAGYSTSAVSRRLAGDTPLTLDDLERLAGAAGFTVSITLNPAVVRAA